MPRLKRKMSEEEATEHRREYQRQYYLKNRDKARDYQRWYCRKHKSKGNKSEETLAAQAKARSVKPDSLPKIVHNLPAEKFAKAVNEYLRDKFIPSLSI